MLFVYAVIKNGPYEGSYPVKHFAKQDDANYYSDWCNAIEHDKIFSLVKKNKYPDSYIDHTHRDHYEVDEFEVTQ